MATSAPSLRHTSTFSGPPAVAMTRAPAARPSWTAADPTPPAPAWTGRGRGGGGSPPPPTGSRPAGAPAPCNRHARIQFLLTVGAAEDGNGPIAPYPSRRGRLAQLRRPAGVRAHRHRPRRCRGDARLALAVLGGARARPGVARLRPRRGAAVPGQRHPPELDDGGESVLAVGGDRRSPRPRHAVGRGLVPGLVDRRRRPLAPPEPGSGGAPVAGRWRGASGGDSHEVPRRRLRPAVLRPPRRQRRLR